MSETETSSQPISQTEVKAEKSTEATSKAKTPTTPTGGSSNWWGSFISQAKEKVSSSRPSFFLVSLSIHSSTSSKFTLSISFPQISLSPIQSASVLEAVKNDLNEITTAVTETLQLAPTDEEEELQQQQQQQQQQSDSSPSDQQSTVNFANMKQSISSSLSTFFGTVTDALIPQLDEEDVSEAVLITNDDTIVLTGFTKFLADLQANDETYLEEPSKTAEWSEKYRMWLEIVEQDQFTQQRVDKMLEQSAILNEK
jgi:hypothetical protein